MEVAMLLTVVMPVYNEGKKITWRDGLSAVWCILKYNLFA
jgi:hypothetical protein